MHQQRDEVGAAETLFGTGKYSGNWVVPFYDETSVWWGPDSEAPEDDRSRAETVSRLCGPGSKRVLELGAGHCATAAAMADRGHSVTALELSPARVRDGRRLLAAVRPGALDIVEGDFYTVRLDGRYDAVCYWDGFGVGGDDDQRRLLSRIAREWLAPGGCALIDVASTWWAMRHAGEATRLAPLPGVPGSVEMDRCWHYDPLHCRWIDEWRPVADPARAMQQSIRTYTPADLLLLLEGTGLRLARLEAAGAALDSRCDDVITAGPLAEQYSFLVQLVNQ